jgi:hypothetical protein
MGRWWVYRWSREGDRQPVQVLVQPLETSNSQRSYNQLVDAIVAFREVLR